MDLPICSSRSALSFYPTHASIRPLNEMAGAPRRFNLDPYRDAIEDRLIDGWTQERILTWLAKEMEEGEAVPSLRTFQRTLNAWGSLHQRTLNLPDAQSNSMIDAIDYVVHREGIYTNRGIVDALAERDIHSSRAQVRNIRLQRGWTLRNREVDAQDRAWERTLELCWRAIEEGPAREWGRGHLQVHLRLEYNWNAALNHVQEALKQINIARGVDRRPGMQPTRRHEALFHGPNFIWSIDGHCKLSPYGIDIYGAIDAYSRKLIWLYVGVSNQTQVSIAKQYLQAVQECGIRPRFIRADRGSEVPMLLDLQFNLYRASEVLERRCARDNVETLSIQECSILGKSTANQRIEQIWLRLMVSQLRPWRSLFRTLFNQQLFRSDTPSDRVVLLYVFIPIIRKEISQWMHVHNNRRIRKDNKRLNHVAGKPSDLYKGIIKGDKRPQDYGIEACAMTLQDAAEILQEYSKSTP